MFFITLISSMSGNLLQLLNVFPSQLNGKIRWYQKTELLKEQGLGFGTQPPLRPHCNFRPLKP
jgi:hypothetical protein